MIHGHYNIIKDKKYPLVLVHLVHNRSVIEKCIRTRSYGYPGLLDYCRPKNTIMLKTNLFPRQFMLAILFLGMFFQNCIEARSQDKKESSEFIILDYNNPDLSVDLGVGLWAWPLPMDFDDDGDMDLVVSCPDTPFNGIYFFSLYVSCR